MTSGYCTYLGTLLAALSWRPSTPVSPSHPDPNPTDHRPVEALLQENLPYSLLLIPLTGWGDGSPMFSELPGHPPSAPEHTAGNSLLAHCTANSQHWASPQWGPPNARMQSGRKGLFRGPGSWRCGEMAGSPAWSGATAITLSLCAHRQWLLLAALLG